MKHVWKFVQGAAAVGLILGAGSIARAQIQYKSGQNVVPIYEGWYKNSDGSIDMLFGYLNRNWEEDLAVPVGPDNSITGLPGGSVDHGQPAIFAHRADGRPQGREQFVFKVRLPKDWGKTQEVTWSVTAHGKTDKVVATLNAVEEVDNIVLAENRGGGIIPENKPPTVALSASAQTVTTAQPVKLSAVFKDDGLPKPKAARPAAAPSAAGAEGRPQRGPRVVWVYYRGPSPSAVKFQPATSPVTGTSATVETTATFSAPGIYVLRAVAEDGPLYDTADVTIDVKASVPTHGQ